MIDLEYILAQQEPAIRRGFLAMVANMRNEIDLDELARLIEEGRTADALALVLRGAPNIATASTGAFIAAAQATAQALGRELGSIVIDYDLTNTAAVAAMRENRLALVQGFSTGQQEATRQAISSGIRDGLNPREQARRFRDSIGLTAKQQAAVEAYERALRNASRDALGNKLRNRADDAAVARAAALGEALPEARIRRMVEQYRKRMLAHRATVIARTEALRSVHEGAESMLQQAIDDGTLDSDQIEREWLTSKDERVRGSHRTMHRQKRPVGVPFTSGNGISLMRPGDARAPAREVIQCRCRVVVRIRVPALEP
jgi:hypothetical protein